MYCTSSLEGVHVFINLVKYVLVGDQDCDKVNCPAKSLPLTL